MKRKLATIQVIADIQPIENADNIEVVKIKDWLCVSKKSTFKKGDKCVYFEIDSLMPSDNEDFKFLATGTKEREMAIEGKIYKGYRLKTKKLRGQISQGLALPTYILEGLKFSTDTREEPKYTFKEGFDVSELLNIVKYEPSLPACLSGKVKGLFPSFIPKTDEERIQNCGDILERHQNTSFIVTEKLDGSSATYYKRNGEFGVCSRNLELLESEGNAFWKIAKRYDLENILPEGYAIQGEVIGEGIQSNPLQLQGIDLYVYNVFNISECKYLSCEEFEKFIVSLGLKTVPILDKDFKLPQAVDELLKYAEGNSVIVPLRKREGIVIRPVKEMLETINRVLTRFSFKVISNKYLLTEKE